MPLFPGFPYRSHYLGETQVVDASGNILARRRRTEGEGFVIADMHIEEAESPLEPVPDRFWIPCLPPQVRFVWSYQNLHGRLYYRRRTQQ